MKRQEFQYKKRGKKSSKNEVLEKIARLRFVFYTSFFILLFSLFQSVRFFFLRVVFPPKNFQSNIEIISRKDWGANEELIFSETPPAVTPRVGGIYDEFPKDLKIREVITQIDGKYLKSAKEFVEKPKRIVIHHTANSESLENLEYIKKYLQKLLEAHTNQENETLFTGDIPYHYLIDKFGNIYEGIVGGDKVVGAHVEGANTGAIGVAIIGNYNMDELSESTLKSLKYLVRELADKYSIDPRKEQKFLGQKVNAIGIHKDYNNTECPGKNIEKKVDEIRSFASQTFVEKENREKNLIFYATIFVISFAVVLYSREVIITLKNSKRV